MDAIRYAYKHKRIDGKIHHPIVKATGKELVKAVEKGYGILGAVDFDSPDYVMREYLKRNIWKFSVAKNYNDCVTISNLLVREDGSLRPWNEFKKEAWRVVGNSNRYLKTEYDTIVAGAQMSRLWQKIQSEKHIFPFVQLSVVLDKNTSDICQPLHNLIFRVDDPVLAYYFPPNHFNCRTTAKQLRYGVPSAGYSLPEIPEAFKNNSGISGQIFTEKNRYIENTPKKFLDASSFYATRSSKYDQLNENPNYYDVKLGDNFGLKATHIDHNFDDRTGQNEKDVQNIGFQLGHEVIFEAEPGKLQNVKYTDGTWDGKLFEIATAETATSSNFRNALKHCASKGKTEIAIIYVPNNNFELQTFLNGLDRYNGLKFDPKQYIEFERIIVINNGKIIYNKSHQ